MWFMRQRGATGTGRFRLALGVAVAVTLGRGGQSRAEWRRNADVVFNTAYTLQEGTLMMGVLGPLDIGVTDALQVGLHPILLLVGKPSVAVRQRLNPVGPLTFALTAGASWSFIERVDGEGREVTADSEGVTGFPGAVHLSLIGTAELSPWLTLTAGAGLGADFLGDSFARAFIPLQLGVHQRLGDTHLLMAQALLQLTPVEGGLRRPSLQLLYGLSLTPLIQLATGLSLGPLPWQTASGGRDIAAFPYVDVWFRF
jgi:hypothetical protein